MPVKTGIQVRLRIRYKNRLDSGFRRNDGKSRVSVEIQKPSASAEGRLVGRVNALLTVS